MRRTGRREGLRARAIAWQEAEQPGPRRTQDMVDAVDLYLATGMRSGEMFALRWDDVDLLGDVARLRVSGTVRRQKGVGVPEVRSGRTWVAAAAVRGDDAPPAEDGAEA